jgi:hypothetical protein
MVTGTRDGEAVSTDWVIDCLEAVDPDFVILGDCPTGVDAKALYWCKTSLRPEQYKVHRADWDAARRAGNVRAAGPIRNAAMVAHAVELGALVLAFPRGGPGTADCMRQARAAGLVVEVL